MITRRTLLTGMALLPMASRAARCMGGEPTAHVQGRVRLPSGRRLGYAEYGVPQGPLVFYFHGTPGSRIEAELLESEMIAAGLRVVAVERPGIGLSDYQSGRKILDWPADVEHLAADLGYANQPFGVLSLSGGAPYALASIKCIPHRLTHVAIVSGHTPMSAPVTRGNQDGLIEFASRRPRLARIGFNVSARQLSRNPMRFTDRVGDSWAAVDRQLVFGNPHYRRALINTLNEATRCGTAGVLTDVQLLGGPWGFRICDLPPTSISIWHGGCDPVAPVSMAHYFHRQLASSELIVDPRAGHVTMIKWHAGAILSRFAMVAAQTL